MDRRRQQKVSVKLTVVIWGMDLHGRPFTQPATVRTVSSRGGTLQGVCVQLKAGDVFDLQYQGVKTQFRVVWLGKHGSDKARLASKPSPAASTCGTSIRCAVPPPPGGDKSIKFHKGPGRPKN